MFVATYGVALVLDPAATTPQHVRINNRGAGDCVLTGAIHPRRCVGEDD